MNDIKIVMVDVNEIKPYKSNAKKHPPEQVANIAQSIEAYGFRQPIVVDKEGVIIIGHGRYLAAKHLGKTEVPVHYADDLPPKKVKELRLLDNKLNESEWDFSLLKMDIDGLSFDGFDLDWGITLNENLLDNNDEEYEKRAAEFKYRMESGELSEDSEEYQEFLEKFKAKKTTDDCYTPTNVYEAVADYVSEHYGVNKKDFVRPFYPNGNYQKEKYKPTDIVVDNPPFSIISEICRWYQEHNIKFFMFAPTLTIMDIRAAQKVVCGNTVVYENGANVNTSFVTNMDEYEMRSAPELYARIDKANEENLATMRRELPKYDYPLEVVRATTLAQFSRYGVHFAVRPESCYRISELDEQKKSKKGIFGSGYLISETVTAEREKAEREKAEREKAEREKAERWTLSAREIKIIKGLK